MQPDMHHLDQRKPRDLGNGTVLDEASFWYEGEGRSYFDLRHCPTNSRLAVTYRFNQHGGASIDVPRDDVEKMILNAANLTERVTLDVLGRELESLGAAVQLDHEKSAACSCKELYPETAGANK